MARVFIGLGSNLANESGDSRQILRDAVHALQALSTSKTQVSSLYASSPMGPQDQPDYLNAVALIHTTLPPHDLLDALQKIEQRAGRVRVRRWGERTLDLDILIMDEGDLPSSDNAENPFPKQIIMHDERLSIPHIGILERSFVVQPLLELDASLSIGGIILTKCSAATAQTGIRIVENVDWAD
ncbi:2-amino-4-hydroxy-6-hydroxymethyldihydropteridine diphosphokinase [Aquirhabdus parva]|uniref:2-amino-4-hydroxy-6-hydroxymethyldihydropteridine pyrophosphokinase n=1 Tax=Aquirhabdus parva TaxID=2283318 RepID=A0A345P8A1_9GAMM|nr:2-amino-4-hydroxy-6-hydroxymethyldihydropteridine diphosphokinase [Aquirhabdus parva]AXI03510.1 2-amino-4-hydroxy-6-hydroxymethyldihydropteridine diphosphokinase [Aquirhabdus parva]